MRCINNHKHDLMYKNHTNSRPRLDKIGIFICFLLYECLLFTYDVSYIIYHNTKKLKLIVKSFYILT
jgi:hypothetical protein